MNLILPIAVVGTLAVSVNAPAQSVPAAPTAEAIMAKVAANQDVAEAERSHYVYVQHAKTVSRRGSSLMCEELTDYRVTPGADGSHEELLKVDGKAREKRHYVSYTTLLPDDDQAKPADEGKTAGDGSKPGAGQAKSGQPAESGQGNAAEITAKQNEDDDAISISIGDGTLDRQLVEHMRKNLMNDKSRDGINAELFPLTSKEQAEYAYQLLGRERMNGRDVFHLVFRPKDRQDFGWKGEAYIDTAAFEPVLVTTGMSRKIPFAVRTFLGTNFPGLGFTVTYAPQPDGIWFPVTFSTEFKIEVLFFFRRTVIIDAENRNFEMTHVTSRIVDGVTPVEPQ